LILQALDSYYERLKDAERIDIPLWGFSRQKIHFALLIDFTGNLIQVLDLRDIQGSKRIPRQLIVPEVVKRTSGPPKPNFLWDNSGYVLGADNKENPGRCRQAFEKFREFHHEIGIKPGDEGMAAVLRFLDSWQPEDAPELPHWDDIAGMNLVFRLDRDLQFIHERPAIQDAWLDHHRKNTTGVVATCLVSGAKKPIARLHPDIKGVRGAQVKGAAIVSFNLSAFKSYGKDQNFNAPVSEDITFNYTTALNHLLRFESRQRVQIGDATTVFWTERESPVEGFMRMILSPQDDSGDLKEVRDFLEAVRDGKKLPENIDDADMKFYILGLSPNASRLSVRFWHVSTVGDIVSKIDQHFKDLSIIKSYNNDPEFPAMWQLLRETAVQRKSENISPLLAGAVMRSILTGSEYPQSLLTAIVTRIRADQTLNYLRAAIIKACITRRNRINNKIMEVGMALNSETTDIGYRLGRLFALLEKAQSDAIPGANTTIKDRFFGSASATPRTVFPQLMRLAQHHIQKSEFGRVTDRSIEKVMDGIGEFPAHLNLEEQGMFALGYYHQRTTIFKKKTKEEE